MKKMLSLLLALTMLLTCASAMAEIPATFHAEGMPDCGRTRFLQRADHALGRHGPTPSPPTPSLQTWRRKPM